MSQLQEYYGQIEQFVNLLSELSPEEMMAFAEAMESPDSGK
ncbi:hypothetical protein [Halovenus salina]|uniref:Uncharacterized protein n=1 Tax=Halovenus salina TaxID=1510225 RepID=A0ABD5VWW8_9EURY